jgi:hypothetical protein
MNGEQFLMSCLMTHAVQLVLLGNNFKKGDYITDVVGVRKQEEKSQILKLMSEKVQTVLNCLKIL